MLRSTGPAYILAFLSTVASGSGEIRNAVALAKLDPTSPPSYECKGPGVVASGKFTDLRLDIRRKPSRPEYATSLTGKRFRYVPTNKGEWGGWLTGVGPDIKSFRIPTGNVVALFPVSDQLFVFAGLDHIGRDGRVYVVDKYDAAPTASLVTLLPDLPDVIAQQGDSDNFILVSYKSIVLLRGTRKVEVLMYGLFPLYNANSAVWVDDGLAIGLCDGLAVVNFLDEGAPFNFQYKKPTVRYYKAPPNNALDR